MSAVLQPVVLRLLAYALSSLLAMIPAAYVGFITYDTAHQALSMSLPALAGIVAAAVAASGGIVVKWGIKVPSDAVSGVVLRVLLYAVTPLLAMIPASFAGVVSFDAVHQVLTVSLGGLVTLAIAAVGASSAIFAKWGIKVPVPVAAK